MARIWEWFGKGMNKNIYKHLTHPTGFLVFIYLCFTQQKLNLTMLKRKHSNGPSYPPPFNTKFSRCSSDNLERERIVEPGTHADKQSRESRVRKTSAWHWNVPVPSRSSSQLFKFGEMSFKHMAYVKKTMIISICKHIGVKMCDNYG